MNIKKLYPTFITTFILVVGLTFFSPSAAPLPLLLGTFIAMFFLGVQIVSFVLNKLLLVKNSYMGWLAMSCLLISILLRSLRQLSFLDGVLITSLAVMLCWYIATLNSNRTDIN